MTTKTPTLEQIKQAAARARQHDPHAYEMNTQLLEAAIEYRERRILFFAAMRQPEMRWVREAFKHLRNDTRHNWWDIREIEIDPPIQIEGYSGAWAMRTDRFVTLLHYPEQYAGHEDFMTVDHHDDNNAYCECWHCYDATLEKRKQAEVSRHE